MRSSDRGKDDERGGFAVCGTFGDMRRITHKRAPEIEDSKREHAARLLAIDRSTGKAAAGVFGRSQNAKSTGAAVFLKSL
jgi:hypothetical protein